jgi:hypothetical protein
MTLVDSFPTIDSDVAGHMTAELSRTGGLLRLAPCWVPRSFLQPGLRLKLHPDDTYVFGAFLEQLMPPTSAGWTVASVFS